MMNVTRRDVLRGGLWAAAAFSGHRLGLGAWATARPRANHRTPATTTELVFGDGTDPTGQVLLNDEPFESGGEAHQGDDVSFSGWIKPQSSGTVALTAHTIYRVVIDWQPGSGVGGKSWNTQTWIMPFDDQQDLETNAQLLTAGNRSIAPMLFAAWQRFAIGYQQIPEGTGEGDLYLKLKEGGGSPLLEAEVTFDIT